MRLYRELVLGIMEVVPPGGEGEAALGAAEVEWLQQTGPGSLLCLS